MASNRATSLPGTIDERFSGVVPNIDSLCSLIITILQVHCPCGFYQTGESDSDDSAKEKLFRNACSNRRVLAHVIERVQLRFYLRSTMHKFKQPP